ncbi:MAG: hypothetical protein ABI459_10090 [Deltaproteobacteria bacterium]
MTVSRRIFLVGLAGATLASCGRIKDTKLNPRNWFGKSSARRVKLSPEELAAVDNRGIVEQISTLSIEPTKGGAIIRATGVPPVQGYFDGELVPVTLENADPAELVYVFRVDGPWGEKRASSQASREVVVAVFLSNIKLEGIRRITVQTAQNSRTLSR